MQPTDAHQAQLSELADQCIGFVEELSALERTIRQYAWSIDQERRELAALGSKIATLELAVIAQKAASA
jgi:hypothetical protein